MANCMLTTTDNEFNPFTHFDEWYARDLELARNQNRRDCLGYLAIILQVPEDASELEYENAYEEAIDEICELNLSGKYRKVVQSEASAGE